MLHFETKDNKESRAQPWQEPVDKVNYLLTNNEINNTQVLRSTILVNIIDKNKAHVVRALLGSDSQSSFITQNLCGILHLPRRQISVTVSGSEISGECKLLGYRFKREY